jgi:hypothetical protein
MAERRAYPGRELVSPSDSGNGPKSGPTRSQPFHPGALGSSPRGPTTDDQISKIGDPDGRIRRRLPTRRRSTVGR